MSDLVFLSRVQMRRIEPFFPRSRGLRRVDDRRVISGIIYMTVLQPATTDALIPSSPQSASQSP